MKLAEYRQMINNTTTEKELSQIACMAFVEDPDALSGRKTLYDQVVSLCVTREYELGIGRWKK